MIIIILQGTGTVDYWVSEIDIVYNVCKLQADL